MAKKTTLFNPKHPIIMKGEVGQRAKEAARKLSNKELDKVLTENMADPEELAQVLTWPRHKKIDFIKRCAECNFVKDWNAAKSEVLEELGAE